MYDQGLDSSPWKTNYTNIKKEVKVMSIRFTKEIYPSEDAWVEGFQGDIL